MEFPRLWGSAILLVTTPSNAARVQLSTPACVLIIMENDKVHFPEGFLEGFCKRNHIQKLSFFGSVLRSDFRSDSDVDMLVEFASGKTPSLLRIAGLEIELAKIVGRKVDLRTPEDLGRHMRTRILGEAQLQYAYRG